MLSNLMTEYKAESKGNKVILSPRAFRIIMKTGGLES